MARNEFEKATTNYGNNFTNNGGIHYYTTHGHKYDDSAYVLAKLNGQVDPLSISSTKIGYPSNNVTTYGQGYDVSVKSHTHIDDYTQTITLGWPSNINTKGKIEGTLTFSVDKTTVPASGGTVNIHFPDLKYTATRDTRGYRYVDVTLKPDVPSNPDDLDDDGTAFSNATVESTTYVGENRQGFLNYQEPMMDYVIYSSYGAKGDNPFYLKAETKIYNLPDSISVTDKAADIRSTSAIVNTYMHMYDNKNIKYSYAYAPYHDEVKSTSAFSTSEGVGWTHTNTRLEVDDNFLSTYPKRLTIAYNKPTIGNYYNISYDGSYGLATIGLGAVFEYNGSYAYGVTSSTWMDTNLTSYDRSTVLHNFFPGNIANTSTRPSYLATSYTITQPKATLTTSYMWTLPEGGDCTNYDAKTGKKYVGFGEWEDTWVSITGNEPILYVNKQDHYMGYVSGNLEVSLAAEATERIINIDNGTTKEGTIGNLKWTDCENGTERFFNARVITKYDNCRNQNITSISGEYYNNDRRMPMVTLKCRQLPANWSHPGIRFKYKCQRYLIPDDTRFNNLNPFTYIYDKYGPVASTGEVISGKDWTISTHRHYCVSSIDTNNTKLKFDIAMPVISTPYIKSTVGGSISASASTTYVGPTKSDITITPTWNVYYTRGYDKGFDAAEWKYSFIGVEGYNDYQGSYDGTGMDCSGVTGFNDFIVHLNKCEDFNYRYPSITLSARSSNSTFRLNTRTNIAESEHSLADGAKSKGFTVSVPANSKKRGTEWSASISTTPTSSTDGYISIGSGNLKNSVSRSTTIRFNNSFDTDLTSGSITSPSDITITQDADKWGGSDSIAICFDKAGDVFISNSGMCIMQSIPSIGSNANSNTYNLGKLKSRHQLVLTGQGTLAGSNKTCSYRDTSVIVTSSGTPTYESSSAFTYTGTVRAWCDDYNKIGVTYGPNGLSSTKIAEYTIRPKALSWKRQYKLLDDSNIYDLTIGWQDSASFDIGNNIGKTLSASCKRNSRAINNGPFTFTPEKYLGSSPRTFSFEVAAYDNNSGVRYIKDVDYAISQDGSDSAYYTSSFTFSSSTTRCTVNGLQSKIESDTPQYCGSFTVTPATNPFTGNITYTNGMVPGSHSNNIKSGITSGSRTITKKGSSKTDFDYGTTNPNTTIGVQGDNTIVYSTTGALKYKFYYSYTVTCSSGAKATGSGISDEQTWTPPGVKPTNYTLKMRYKSPSMSNYSSWSTTLTTTANAMGTWSVQGAFMSGDKIYGSASSFKFEFKAKTVYTVYRTVYKYTGSVSASVTNQIISAFDTDKTQSASATWSCTYWKRTDSRASNVSTYTKGTWVQVDNSTIHGSINATTYTFTNVATGSSSSDKGNGTSFTFTVTPPSNPNNLNDGTWSATATAYMYGKSYYNN